MTYRIVIEPRAERGIRMAVLWILGQSGSRATAVRWARGLRAKIETLANQPQRCPFDPDSEVYGEDVGGSSMVGGGVYTACCFRFAARPSTC